MNNLLLLSLLIFTVACGNSVEFKEGPVDFSQTINFSADELTFENISEKILNKRIDNRKSCTECHFAYADYSTVSNVTEREKILDAVLTGRMPKNAPALSNDLKALLSAWVEAGAPLGAGTDTQPPVQLELEATWESLSQKVFFPKCVQCHNPNGQASFMDLSTRQKFFEQRKTLLNDFIAGESSYLIEVITDPVEPMPPISSGIERLNEDEVQTIIEWIEKGLP